MDIILNGSMWRRRSWRERRPTVIVGESMTKQSFRDEVNINTIVAKYVRDGFFPPAQVRETYFGDFSSVGDYQSCLDKVLAMEERFAALPAAVRSHCRNDPTELLALVDDPARVGELEELGLIPKQGDAPLRAPEALEDAPGEPENGSVAVGTVPNT